MGWQALSLHAHVAVLKSGEKRPEDLSERPVHVSVISGRKPR